jgi:hypothetical protein
MSDLNKQAPPATAANAIRFVFLLAVICCYDDATGAPLSETTTRTWRNGAGIEVAVIPFAN